MAFSTESRAERFGKSSQERFVDTFEENRLSYALSSVTTALKLFHGSWGSKGTSAREKPSLKVALLGSLYYDL